MIRILFLTLVLSLALAACGTSAPAASSTTNTDTGAYVSTNLDTSYENALSVRLQLNLGSLKLAETATPITPEQAKAMLPLWQGLQNMTNSGNSAQAEVNAILAQIEATFTPDQLTAIREMKLVSADIQTWAAANNVTSGGGGQPGSGQGQGGGSGMSAEARATRQAEEGVTSGTGGNGISTQMLNALIEYLETVAG